ncbi:MAG: IgA Peptidase M64 [Acidobacteria bacterium]|nr:IgA Peptidase M64 [Acidobacteriota bacterium]
MVIFLLAAAMLPAAAPPATLRVDYIHAGNAAEEHFSLDEIVSEGPWPGPLDKRIDTSNLGKYLFEVRDASTGQPWYSRGFASIYGEWESTPEAAKLRRAFQESLRFPQPPGKVKVVLKKRGARNQWRDVWQVEVDPADPAIHRAGPPGEFHVWPVMRNGDPAGKVDLLLLGDGYAAAEMDKWHRDARRLTELLFAVSPFRERRSDFNVWAIDTPATASGISQPSDGVYRRSPVRTTYDAFGSERYILTFDNKRLREIASAAPYEFIEIVTNGRKYGGGGIHNLYATVVSDNSSTPYIFVHEFGHHFAGLADEYYTSDVAYSPAADRPEPWEPNATADPQAAKWKDLITAGTPLPTPWPKKELEAIESDIQRRRREIRARKLSEERMEALFDEELRKLVPLVGSAQYARRVGAFEGAMYEARGYYRPQIDCTMFTRDPAGFCAVCRRAIERVIAMYTGR